MEIRLARPEEYTAVGDLVVRVYIDDGLVDAGNPYVAVLADAPGRARLAELFVAVTDAGVVGTVTYATGGTEYAETAATGEAAFRMLAVDPAARGTGVGAALVTFCVDLARTRGAARLRLSTAPDMTAAHRLYERLGFHRTPDRDWRPQPAVWLLTYVLELG